MTSLKNTIFNSKYLLPLIIFVISLFVVFYQFLNIPKNTTFDEIEFAKLALQLENKPYAPYSMYATGHATLYFYIILTSFKLFGVSLFSLRLPAALFGILCPIVFYFVIKRIFQNGFLSSPRRRGSNLDSLHGEPVQGEPVLRGNDTWIPFLLSFIFITLRWYFNFARFGFEVTFLLFLELISLLFIFLFAEKKQIKYLIFSGIFAGLAYNSYQPGRIFVLIPIFVLFLTIIKNSTKKLPIIPWKGIQSKITLLSYFLIPFFILILPLTIYLNIHKDTRFYQQFYPDNHEMTLKEKGEFFTRNLTSTIGIFHIRGDVNGRHNYPNKPALNPVLGILFVAGFIISLKNIKHKNNQIFLLWFFLSLVPTLVTYPWENPNMLRTFTAIPSIVYFIGLALVKIISISHTLSFTRFKNILYISIFIIICLSSFYELRTYFVHQSTVFREAFEAERPLNTYLNTINEK